MKFVNALSAIVVVITCTSVQTIKVPVSWQDVENIEKLGEIREPSESKLDSEVNEFDDDIPQPIKVNIPPPVPAEYFLYPNHKPKYAVEIAQFHGLPSPQNYFEATPVHPVINEKSSKLGIHVLPAPHYVLTPLQRFEKTHDNLKHFFSQPVSANYDVFHPYQQEIPHLIEHYKDPNLIKIQNDVNDNKQRLQKYEEKAGETNLNKDDYLKSPEETESEKFQESEDQTYQAEKKPIYYDKPKTENKHIARLNSRLQDPTNQNIAKIKPSHYIPLKTHVSQFKQNQALQFGEGINDYPEKKKYNSGHFAEPPEGYDIYEKEKENFDNIKLELLGEDESQEKKLKKENLEIKKNGKVKKEFVPVKSYAQVRKTESKKHLPKKAAYDDADSLDDVANAPRLREAVKSTKAQTIYSEEGYEDSAYDHAGQQKHASNHEGHGGFLKQNEKSKGKYKGPEYDDDHREGGGEYSGKSVDDGKTWDNADGQSEEYNDEEIEIEDEGEEGKDVDYEKEAYTGPSVEDEIDISEARNEEYVAKKYPYSSNSEDYQNYGENSNTKKRRKRNTKFEIPSLDLKESFLTDKEMLDVPINKFSKLTTSKKVNKPKHLRYPYYKSSKLHKISPLRYAENLDMVPKKTNGGTEFYDSRSHIQCPEVDDEVDPVPERIANHDPENEKKLSRKKRDETNKEPRLNGLGDKIDCFKAKYFGNNPLDSPFFKEDIVDIPEPFQEPKLKILDFLKKNITKLSKLKNNSDLIEGAPSNNEAVVLLVESKRKPVNQNLTGDNKDFGKKLMAIIETPQPINDELSIYSDILKNIRHSLTENNGSDPQIIPLLLTSDSNEGHRIDNFPSFKSYKNKKEVVKDKSYRRNKRSLDFRYEPYKIIKSVSEPDTKTQIHPGLISPLIKTLQSSKSINTKTSQQNNLQNYFPLIHSKSTKEINLEDLKTPIMVIESDRKGEPMYEITKTIKTKPRNQTMNRREPYKFIKYDPNRTNKEEIKVSELTESTHSKLDLPFFDVTAYLPKPLGRYRRNNSDDSEESRPKIQFRRRIRIGQNPDTDSKNSGLLAEMSNSNSYETTTFSSTPKNTKVLLHGREKLIHSNIQETTTFSSRNRGKNGPSFKKENNQNATTESRPTTNARRNGKYIQPRTIQPKISEKSTKKQETRVFTDTQSYGEEKIDDTNREHVDSMIDSKDTMEEYIPDEFKENDHTQPLKIKIRPKIQQSSEEFRDTSESESSEESFQSYEDSTEPNNQSSLSQEKTSHQHESQDKTVAKIDPNRNIDKQPPNDDEHEKAKTSEKQFEIPEDVEVIKQDLRVDEGPKHGGNYRRITEEEIEKENQNDKYQVDMRKVSNLNHRLSNYKVLDKNNRSEKIQTDKSELKPNFRDQNSRKGPKTDKPDIVIPLEHNSQKIKRRRGKIVDNAAEPTGNIAKVTELLEEEADDQIQMHGGNLKHSETTPSSDQLSVPIVEKSPVNRRFQSEAHRAADVLNILAQAIPVLTTSPPYILDPSKRMYYYVDA